MASIAISNLQPVGSDLFQDSENFMMDLSENELYVTGGILPALAASSGACAAGAAFVAGAIIGWWVN